MAWNVLQIAFDPSSAIWPNHQPGYVSLALRVDGCDLLDIVDDAQRAFIGGTSDAQTIGDGRDRICARNGHFGPLWLKDVVRGCLETPDGFYKREKSIVSMCSCRNIGCGELLARITLRDDSVLWSEFESATMSTTPHPRRDWNHDRIGPFLFERAAYDAELARCKVYWDWAVIESDRRSKQTD